MTNSKQRLVIRDLREPTETGPRVIVHNNLSMTEADQMLRRFTKLKWTQRRDRVWTIDHVALLIEFDDGPIGSSHWPHRRV